MRAILYFILMMAICVISGCISSEMFSNPSGLPEEQSAPDLTLRGSYSAKPNSIGCYLYNDLEIANSGDFDTIDNLIRNRKCFVIPTDSTIIIQERAKWDIVIAKIKGSSQAFYTAKSNLLLH